jgi:hypothetical protein
VAAQGPTSADHVLGAQPFDDDYALALGVSFRFAVQNVIALPADFTMELGHAHSGVLPVLGAFLLARKRSLRTLQTLLSIFKVLRVWNNSAVGIGKQIRHTPVNADGWFP